jgi:hypothetical protein
MASVTGGGTMRQIRSAAWPSVPERTKSSGKPVRRFSSGIVNLRSCSGLEHAC